MGLSSIVCASANAGAISYFNMLNREIALLIVDDMAKIKDVEAKCFITGAALGDTIDKEVINYSKTQMKPCISVVEHWSWYRKRFELNGELILPDFIFVNDEIAYADAVHEGLPSEIIFIAGNPVLESLRICDNRQQIERAKLLDDYSLATKRIVVFISEEIASEFNGTEDELGYDEFSTLAQLLLLLKPSDHLVIKLHPAEAESKYNYLNNKQVSVIRSIDIFSLNTIADVVVGMASMLLLELAMLRNDVISFRPNATKRFIGERLSATVDVTSQEGLDRILSCPQYLDGKFRERFDGLFAIIKSLIRSIMG